jgi:E1A-binding protein p400
MRNPKHAAVLADIGIIYDQPLTPIEVATRRAERIAKEKQKTAQAASVSIPVTSSLAFKLYRFTLIYTFLVICCFCM